MPLDQRTFIAPAASREEEAARANRARRRAASSETLESRAAAARAAEAAMTPDRRQVRGNPPVDRAELERCYERLDRVIAH